MIKNLCHEKKSSEAFLSLWWPFRQILLQMVPRASNVVTNSSEENTSDSRQKCFKGAKAGW